MKNVNITPLFKGGDRAVVSNYRPVSLTSIISRLFESILCSAMKKHLNANNLISPDQHGFVSGRACVTNLLECQDLTTSAMKNSTSVDVLYTDFAKAFDKVSHLKLLHKVKAYGFDNKFIAWIRSFLTDRTQRIVKGEIVSNSREVWSGVPQGSVIGPLLFVIYINDMPEHVSCPMKLYADDSKLFALIRKDSLEFDLQKDICAISSWCCLWSMKLNAAKCKIMHIGNNNENRTYSIDDGKKITTLATTEMEKDLGVLVCSNGRWSEQAISAASKANRVLGMMRNTFRYWSDEVAQIVYPTFVRPHLEFASSVWNPRRKKDIAILEKVQHRATKTYNSRHLNYEDRLIKFGFTTLEQRRHRGDLIQCYKLVHGIEKVNWCPENKILSRFGNNISTRRHNLQLTREIIKGCEPRFNFLLNRIATPWNNLPHNIVFAPSVNSFKNRIDIYLKQVNWETYTYG